MPPFETIVRPRRNRISVPVPKGYGSCSFQVILVPLAQDAPPPPKRTAKRSLVEALMSCPCDISGLIGDRSGDQPSFVDALLSCPKLAEGETFDVSRDRTDFGQEVVL